jgi:signal peptidase I
MSDMIFYNAVTVFLLILAAGIRTVFEPFHVPAGSMSPNINKEDYFFADRRSYTEGRLPQRGDIIVFRLLKYPSVTYVKRIMGLPGERVQLKGGVVYINDKPLPRRVLENYEYAGKSVPRFAEILPEGREITILKLPKGDSDESEIYTAPEGYYFVMGDNRDFSHDSRSPEIGFVPRENIIGKADAVWWNGETFTLTHHPIQ